MGQDHSPWWLPPGGATHSQKQVWLLRWWQRTPVSNNLTTWVWFPCHYVAREWDKMPLQSTAWCVLILVWMPVHCISVQRQYQCYSGAALECHPPCWQTSAHCIRQTSVPVSLQVLLVVINCVWLVRQPILVCTRNNHQFLSLSAKWLADVPVVCMQVLSWAWQRVLMLHALHRITR